MSELDRIVVMVNRTKFTRAAFDKLGSVGVNIQEVEYKAWLMGVMLQNGQTVAAYPISSLNSLAPPSFYMTDTECNHGITNRTTPTKIVRHLKKWCKDESLIDAVKEIKRSIKALEN